MNLTRRTLLTAMSAAVAAQAQRSRAPNWKPKLGVLCRYTDPNLDFVKSEGFCKEVTGISYPLLTNTYHGGRGSVSGVRTEPRP